MPVLLDSDQIESLGLTGLASGWHDKWFSEDDIEFVVLLPGFVMEQSTWEGGLGSVGKTVGLGEPPVTVFGVEPTCITTSAGLVLHFKIKDTGHANAILTIEFKPNQGLDEDAIAVANFLLED